MGSITRVLQAGGRLLFDPKFQDSVTSTIKATKRFNVMQGKNSYYNLHQNIGNAFIKAEKRTAKVPFWNNLRNSLKTLLPDIKTAWKNETKLASKGKAAFKQFWKRMPLLGVLMTAAFELPNIFSAFKDKGIVGGILETGKSTVRLAGCTAGFAIGQALIPIPIAGGLIGAFAGDWLLSKVVGKSHSEKKAEEEAKQQELLNQQQLMAQQLYNSQYNQGNYFSDKGIQNLNQQQAYQNMLYNNMYANPMSQDFMANASGLNKLNYQC